MNVSSLTVRSRLPSCSFSILLFVVLVVNVIGIITVSAIGAGAIGYRLDRWPCVETSALNAERQWILGLDAQTRR